MGQQINVNLGFTADTTQAKMAIQDLQNTLQKITLAPVGKSALFDDAEFKRASEAATELQGRIQAAFNQKTGKLDLLKFSTDLKIAGKDVNYFKENLSGVGSLGTQAFLQLAQAIATSEAPMLRLSSRMKEFGTTLANTAKWQLSSSMMHGFMGTIQKAYGYVQNLNSSLNDIRIVSGQSADQMSKFAANANKAARALSATTLDYTNAALVYYQQGLNDEEVKDRTDITIKMANVSQQSAEIVSDQLTAVWNNFAKGGENLEHFADVMVRLGADTASSSDEIAEGLEKFAAIGDTVGLSFDNAAAALATVTAKTRQSADVVGTAFKTLFARIQDLELGDTLEDGTTLGKYSEALKAVGIDIKDQAGGLKDMDIILNEMGNKWTTLSKDQQVALAQTVAGTRQYTQLIALMDNFDFYQENLQSAINSDGSLQEQANIYAESWEAARDRVQAALENIYTKLISDDFFIDLANGLAKVVDGIGGFIDGLGGVEGLLKSIGSIFMSVYAQKMPEFLNNLKQNIMIITGLGKKQMSKTQTQTAQALDTMQSDSMISNTDKIKAEGISKVSAMQQKYIQNMRYMSDTEQQEYQAKMKNVQALYAEAEALEETYQKMQKYQSRNATATNVQRSRQNADQELRAIEAESEALQQEKKRRLEEINQNGNENEANDAVNKEFANRESEIEHRRLIAQKRVQSFDGRDSKQVISDFNEAADKYYKTSAESGLAMGIASSLASQNSSWKAQKVLIGENEQETKKLEIQMRSYLQTLSKIAKQNGFDDLEKSLSQIIEEQENANGKIEETSKDIDITTASYEELLKVMENASAQAEKLVGDKLDRSVEAEEAVESYRDLIGEAAVSDAKKNAENIRENRENSTRTGELRNRPIDNSSNSIKNSQVFMSLAGAALQAQAAIQAVTNAIQIFNDESATMSEKIGALISLIGTAGPSIIQTASAFKDLRNSKIVSALASKIAAAADLELAGSQAILNVALAATLLIIAAVVSAIALFVMAIKNNADAYNAEAVQAEKSNQVLQEQKDLLEEVKNKHEELISAIQNYKDAYEALNQMTQGTEEWKEQVRELNQQIVDLITKYPELSKLVERDENGLLLLNDKGLKEAVNKSQQSEIEAENRVIMAQRRANIDNMRAEIAEKAGNAYTSGDYWNNIFEKAQYGAAGGSVGGPLGLVGGALFGGIIGIFDAQQKDIESKENYIAQFDKILENSQKYNDVNEYLSLESTQNAINELAEALSIGAEQIIEIVRDNDNMLTSNDILLEQKAANMASNNKNYQQTKYKDVVDAKIKDAINPDNLSDNEKADKDALRDKIGWWSNPEDYEEFLKLKYGDQAKSYRVTDTKGGDVTLQHYDEETKTWNTVGDENDYSKDDIAAEWAKLKDEKTAESKGEKFDIDSFVKELVNKETEFKKEYGLSDEGTQALVRASSLGKTVDFSQFTELDIEKIRQNFDSLKQLGVITDEALKSFDSAGGILGARNESFSELFKKSQGIQDLDKGENLEDIKQTVAEAQGFYNNLNEEDKRLFAEAADFKIATNREAMEQILADTKAEKIAEKAKTLAEQYELNIDVLKDLADGYVEADKTGEMTIDTATNQAVAYARTARGVQDLYDHIEDYSEALLDLQNTSSKEEKAIKRNTETFSNLKKSLADILNVTEGLIDADLYEAINPADLKQAAQGDVQAINKIRDAFIDLQANGIQGVDVSAFKSQMASIADEASLIGDNNNWTDGIDTFLDTLIRAKVQAGATATEIQGLLSGIGISVDDVTFYSDMASAQAAAAETGGVIVDNLSFTSENQPIIAEADDKSDSVGWSQTANINNQTAPLSVPLTAENGQVTGMYEGTVQVPNVTVDTKANLNEETFKTSQTGFEHKVKNGAGKTGSAGVAVVKAPKKSKVSSYAPSKKSSGGSGGKGGGGGGKGGGGGSQKVVQKKAPIKPKKADEEIERYHEITKSINNQSKLLDRLSKAKDAAYGPNKLKQMNKEIEATKTLIELNKQHIKEIRENLKLDKERAASFGVTFNEQGLINNYDEIIQQKMDEWLAKQNIVQQKEYDYEAAKNADENYDADGQIKLDIEQEKEAADEAYENFKKAISQYEETYDLFNEKAAELAEKYREISQKTLEKIQYKVQLKLDFNDLERQFIKVRQAMLGDGWEKFSEVVLLASQNINTLTGDLAANKQGIMDLLQQYHQGMDQSVFLDGIKELISNGLGNIKDILSADTDMLNMYGDAIDSANEEISKWTDLIDAGTNKLDHFKELSSLLRKDEDNEWINTILQAQQKTLNNRYDVSKKRFEVLKDEYDALYTRWNNEKNTLPQKELEMLETKLYAAASAMNEAEDQMLSDLEAVGEKAQEILENNISKAQKQLEKNLFGDTYENYMDQIDKLNLKQEEYLTNTNKMYETNKLIRQAQQDMDKTSNNRAKQQYNDYVKYIEQLQESGKLSNYQLSIAQARYEVLKAQIALEDAKDAKDQVRLTRDSEGNFGYIYTANQDKVESAQQNFEDAQNKLYNIGLDGAKEYQAKSNEVYENWLNDMQKIQEQWQTGVITSETEFRAEQERVTKFWQDQLSIYNEQYYTAHDLLVEESYDNTADYMLKGTLSISDFKNNTGTYLSDIQGYYKDYDTTVTEIETTVGGNLKELADKTENVTEKTEDLSNMIVDDLLPKMDEQFQKIRDVTSEYGKLRDAIWEVVQAAEALMKKTMDNEIAINTGELDDYSLKLADLISENDQLTYDDPLVQQLLHDRYFVKMDGSDPWNYRAWMQQEEATNGTNTAWYKALTWMLKYKQIQTDWQGVYNVNPEQNAYAKDVRQETLDSYDFAQELINLGTKNPGLTTDDERVKNILNKRKAKIQQMEAKNMDLSKVEPVASLLRRAGIADVSANGYSPTALYNTGGYTGTWGPEGKLAVLHEKELVLNAQDTENILSSVNILRQISQALDNNAIWASLGLGGLNAASIGTLADQTLQQEVHISADFPNVTDHNEIEMAIDNLINAASQYAYRK